jgi:hypothetical protein
MDDNKKYILNGYLRDMQSKITKLYLALEEDESIPEKNLREYEEMINKIFELHTQVEEEIYLG